jgi:hypothetical protein
MKTDSKEELYFTWWLDDLIKAGLIEKYERAESFQLSSPVKVKVAKQLKTKVKMVERHLLDGHLYTPDFVVKFDRDFAKKCKLWGFSGLCIIEIKADYDKDNMTRLFRINQKWVWKDYGVLVNLVKIPSFFKKTFTPKRYLLTDKTMKPRRLGYKPRTLKQFMES